MKRILFSALLALMCIAHASSQKYEIRYDSITNSIKYNKLTKSSEGNPEQSTFTLFILGFRKNNASRVS